MVKAAPMVSASLAVQGLPTLLSSGSAAVCGTAGDDQG